MFTYDVPVYCESLHHIGYVNVLTNLAFIIAAVFAWRTTRLAGSILLKALVVLLGVIGVGSTVFHLVPNRFTILFDALPIYIFLAVAFYTLFVRITESRRIAGAVVGGVLLYIGITFMLPSDFLGGSSRHIGMLLFAFVTAIAATRRLTDSKFFFLALALYATAIAFHAVDLRFCGFFGSGTHFMWHLCNALAGYVFIMFLAVTIKRPQK